MAHNLPFLEELYTAFSMFEESEGMKRKVAHSQDEEEDHNSFLSNILINKKFKFKKQKMSINLSSDNLMCHLNVNCEMIENKEVKLALPTNNSDDRGFYQYSISEILDSRFRVMALIGSGVFSIVLRCVHVDSDLPNQEVAIKVIL